MLHNLVQDINREAIETLGPHYHRIPIIITNHVIILQRQLH